MRAARVIALAILLLSPVLGLDRAYGQPMPDKAILPSDAHLDYSPGQVATPEAQTVDIPIGTLIPVTIETPLSSKTAQTGDMVRAKLAHDMQVGGRIFVPEGAELIGRVTYSQGARRRLVAKVSPERWFRSSGCIGLQFDAIVTSSGQEIPIIAVPHYRAPVVSPWRCAGPLSVNNKGQIRPTILTALKQETKPLVVSGFALGAGLLISPFAAPIAGAAMGAAKPNLVLSPSEIEPKHKRLKGMLMGAVSGLPGGFLVTQAATRGEEVNLHEEDRIMLEIRGSFSDGATAASSKPAIKAECDRS